MPSLFSSMVGNTRPIITFPRLKQIFDTFFGSPRRRVPNKRVHREVSLRLVHVGNCYEMRLRTRSNEKDRVQRIESIGFSLASSYSRTDSRAFGTIERRSRIW